MGGEEEAAGRVRGLLPLVEQLDRVDLPVPERVLDLVVGGRDDHREVLAQQDRRAEQLVTERHARAREGYDVVLDHVEQPLVQRGHSVKLVAQHVVGMTEGPDPMVRAFCHW